MRQGIRDWIRKAADGGLHIRQRGDVNPDMTRAKRNAWRPDHPEEWRRTLRRWIHYDPDYPYDIGHDHDRDWTTGPEYTSAGVHFSEYDDGGAYHPSDIRRKAVP